MNKVASRPARAGLDTGFVNQRPARHRRSEWRQALLLAGFGWIALMAGPAVAQTNAGCTPVTGSDWMTAANPLAQAIRPRDCATVEQSPPDFRWPEASSSASYSLTLIYPDGHARTLPATQNWRNWDETLPAGTYSWRVTYSGGTSLQRKFTVASNARPFLVPPPATLISTITAKPHPRSLPDATTLATMKSQRQTLISALLTDVNSRLTAALPSAGSGANDAFNYSKYALSSLQACVFTGQDSYCNDAIRRVANLASWDPSGATSYTAAGVDMAARYLTWTVATGYDWLYPRLNSTQRSQLLTNIRTRNGAMYNDVIGSRSRLATTPRDSHGNQTLSFVADIAALVLGDLSDANTWATNSLPLALNAVSPWGDDEGGFANANTQGIWDMGETLPVWVQLRYMTGVDLAQKAWVRNWSRWLTYFTPPGMPGGTTVFGDGFEMNELEHQARYGKGYIYFAPSPLGRWHASQLSGETARIEYLMAPPADFTGVQPFPAGTPNALALTAIGQVAMHSDLSSAGRTSIYFKSSPPPYGAFNHSHADQNGFVINAGGQRLAIESGYYDGYKTAHWLNWYHTTQAKNAITYDGGVGQLFYEKDGKMGYGKLTGFTTTSGYDIVTGDATQAYGGALTKAVRSMVYLRPNLIVVYDNLASATARQWEWNIHSLNQMAVASNTQVMIQNGTQKLCITQLAGPAVNFSQTSQFSTAPTSGAQQWHGRFTSTTRLAATEFVTLLNVGCTTTTASARKATDGTWTIPVGDRTVSIGATGGISVAATATASTSTGTTSGTTTGTTTTTSPAISTTTTTTTTTAPTTTTTSPTTTTTATTAATATTATTSGLPSTNTRAVATFESIGLYWTPPSNPGTAGCSIRYQKAGETTWHDGYPMWYDARNGECRGSIVQVSPASTYTVQFAMPGQAPVAQTTVQTWDPAFPIAKTISVPSGSTTYAITEGGSPSGYVLYTSPTGTRSTIDVANKSLYNVTVSAPYVIIRGLTLKGGQQDGIRLLKGAHHVVIEDNDISGWGRFRANSTEGALGMDYDSGIHAVCSDLSLTQVVIQRNKIHDPRYTANSWSTAHPEGPQGISFENCGGNHVIRYNEVTGGTSGNYYNDGIGGCCNFTTAGFPYSDTDIHGNIVMNTWDDGIESEGGNRNVRIWGNYLDQTSIGIATTVVATGPAYIFRNVYNRSRQYKLSSLDSGGRNVFAKSGSQSSTIGGGRRYIFHNTLLQATQSGLLYPLGAGGGIGNAGTSITNTVSRNNIFHIWKTNWQVIEGAGSDNSFGYDLYNGSLGGATETSGINGVPIYQSGNGWTSEAGGMYQLATNSPGYDRGQRLANFNDGFTGAGPDIGAHEAGTPAMVFGVKGGGTASTTGTTSGSTTTTGSTGTSSGTTSGNTTGSTGTTGGTTTTSTPYTGTPFAVPGSFEAENFDRGGEGIGYHDTTASNLGGQYRTSEGVDLIASTDSAGGSYVINNFATGEWLAYTVNIAASARYVIALRVANNYPTTPSFRLELDGVSISGNVPIPATGSWSTFQWVSAPAVTLPAGRHVLRIYAAQNYFNLNSVRITTAP